MAKGKMKWYDWLAIVLLIVGGLNWGLIGFFNWNLVQAVFGYKMLANIIYALVGLSAVYSIYALYKVK